MSSVSTPSATTRKVRLCPRSMIDRTMAACPASDIMSVTKPLSIFSSWTGRDDKKLSDVWPMPKSSMLTPTPRAAYSAKTRSARPGSVSRAVSVISIMRRLASIALSRSAAMTCAAKDSWQMFRAETLTETAM
jgi:hypothetical protein